MSSFYKKIESVIKDGERLNRNHKKKNDFCGEWKIK